MSPSRIFLYLFLSVVTLPSCFLASSISIWKYQLTPFHTILTLNDLDFFQNKPLFLRACNSSLLKTLWEKEKLLVTSNFSFSHNVFYPFGKRSAKLITFKIFTFKLSMKESKICHLGKAVIILGRATGANLSPMAHENVTYGTKWPVKILDGSKFYPDCAKIKKGNLSVFNTSILRETFQVNIYTRVVLSKLHSKVYVQDLI